MTRTTAVLRGVEVVFAAAAVLATLPAYRDFFASGGYLVGLSVATVAGVVVAVLAAALRWGLSGTMVSAIGGFLAVGGPVILEKDIASIGDALIYGWASMLTVALPAEVTGGLLITPALFVYAAGFAAITVTLRTRSLLGPLLFPLLPFLVALSLTAATTGGMFPVAVVVLVSLMALLLVRAARLGDTYTGAHLADRMRFGLPTVALIIVFGVVAALRMSPVDRDRLDPRALLQSRPTLKEVVTPLALVRSQREEKPARELFTVSVTGPETVDRVRTAALDDYDGTFWSSTDSFLAAGKTLAPDPGLPPAAEIELRVTVRGLDQRYLPAVGRPKRIDSAGDIGYCPASGVLTASGTGPRGPGGYHLVADVGRLTDQVRAAGPDASARFKRYRELPDGVPLPLARAADRITGGATTPYQKLDALKDALAAMPITPRPRPGHTYERLGSLFATGPDRAIGSAEQHAAAFTVMARWSGFPARVVTGYLLPPRPLADGAYLVSTSDAWAWSEVYLTGYGWLTFDPTDPKKSGVVPSASPSPATSMPSALASRPPAGPPPADQPAGPGDAAAAGWLSPAMVAVLALLILPGTVVLEKWRRRRYRRTGSPAQRIAGAWRQSTDRLREAGLPIRLSWTARETAGQARIRFGAAALPITRLATLFDTACHGARPPDPAQADEAWRLADVFGTSLRRQRGFASSVGAWLNPRPLLRRRHR